MIHLSCSRGLRSQLAVTDVVTRVNTLQTAIASVSGHEDRPCLSVKKGSREQVILDVRLVLALLAQLNRSRPGTRQQLAESPLKYISQSQSNCQH